MNRSLFDKTLEVLLEGVSPDGGSPFTPAADALSGVQTAKDALGEAERTLQQQVETLNSRLALEIRRNNPSLNVTMGRGGGCCVRYKNFGNCLHLNADPEQQCFGCDDSPFERRFRRYHGHTLNLGEEVLGRAVSDFFRQSYKSIK